MKTNIVTVLLISTFFSFSQDNSTLLNHYEDYYNQMKTQGDVQGVINALTHLTILSPNQARKDTLAVLYKNLVNKQKHILLIG